MSTRKIGRKSAVALAAATGLVLIQQQQANAQTPTNWTAGTGSYLNAANWDNGVPTNAGNSVAFINNTGTAQISGADAAEGAFLILGYQPGDVGHLEISGGTLTIGEGRIGGTEVLSDGLTLNGGGTGTVVQSGGTVNVTYTPGSEPPVQSLYIGDSGLASGNTANGSYTITAGALNAGIANDDSIVIGTGAGATGTFTHQGGDVTSTGFVTVARGGATASYSMSGGTLTVGTGTQATSQNLRIGDGEYPTSTFNSSTSGTFTQSGGTITVLNDSTIGRTTGTGSLTITGASTVYNGQNNMNVGHAGNGTVVQGTVAGTGPTVNIGKIAAGTHGMSVGISSTPTQPGVGSYTLHSGTLSIGDGSADYLAIGDGPNGTGTFTMDGGTINTTDLVQLGRNNSPNNNTFTLSAGTISAGRLIIGGGSGAANGKGTWTMTGGSVTGSLATNIAFGTGTGNTCVGTLDMQGGTWTLTGTAGTDAVFAVGNGSGAVATVNFSGGTLSAETSVGLLDIGRTGAVGTFNLSGAGVLKTTRLRVNSATGNAVNLTGGSSTLGQLNCGAGVVTISGGTHTVTGVTTTDTGTLYLHGGTLNLGTSISLNSASIIRSDVPYTIATAMSLGNITFQVDSSTMTLTGPISDPTNGRSITKTGAGTLDFGSTVSYAATPGTSNINANAGTFNVNSDFNSNSVALNANSGGSIVINTAAQHVGAANVAAGGNLTIAHTTLPAAQTKVLVANAVAPSARLNITNNKLITNTLEGSWNGSAYTGVLGMVASGYTANQDFSGASGIVTTESSATGGNTLTNIGVASATELGNAGATWGGQTIAGTNTLVMYTYGGDANLDGVVNGDDYFQIDSASPGSSGWFNGDFNYDGVINGDDYFVIDSNFAAQGAAFPTSGGALAGVTAVPEPASMSVLAIAASALLARRRRCS